MIQIVEREGIHNIVLDGKAYATILPCPGSVDTFRKLEEGAWEWHRHTDVPTDHMRMELVLFGEPTFTMVPAVSYNGNGWGDFPEYIGDRDEDGTPWSWAAHRVTIPACTYSENEHISIALMSNANDETACSLYSEEDGKHHVLIFPEEEKPRTLQRHFWGPAFQDKMAPRQDFVGIIHTAASDGTKFRYKHLLDFAFRYFGHNFDVPRKAAELEKLSLAFCHFLYQREQDGMAGFTTGAPWSKPLHGYEKHQHRYQIGWVGQNASMANAFIWDYLKTGDKLKLDMAIEALDAWIEHALVGKGLFRSIIDRHPTMYMQYDENTDLDPWKYSEDLIETMKGRIKRSLEGKTRRNPDGSIFTRIDACNLGTGTEGYFEAYYLLQKCGIDKPEYLQLALDVCEFILKQQDDDGAFAKAWDYEGNVLAKEGTVGCFLVLPLLSAYQHTKEEKYLDSAKRAFAFYFRGLEENGFTTAGALDTYSIDKESASPLLRISLKLHALTGEKWYVDASEKIAWYLSTWMMYHTVDYPIDHCIIAQMGFDTFGSTAVSTPHNALDQYALRDVLSFKRLYELTGNIQWRERALALWCGANQCISDGTFVVNGRLRPAGGQDEAIFHTRWGRTLVPGFRPSQWLPAWPCAFRLENLRWSDDWDFFDEGLQHITGKIEH